MGEAGPLPNEALVEGVLSDDGGQAVLAEGLGRGGGHRQESIPIHR